MRVTVSALALAMLLTAAPASAQMSPPGFMSIERAGAIAARYGIVRIDEIELDDGRWEIEGRDRAGREREIEIDARTGRVIKFERD